MATFDIAVGITKNGLNSTLYNLFSNPIAQSKIFTQNVSEIINGINVIVTIVIQSSPVILLTSPSDKQWQQSYNREGKPQTGAPPAGNLFQVILSSFNVNGTVDGLPVNGTDEIQVYADFSLVNNVLKVEALSVWIDESKWEKDGITKFIVNAVIIPRALNTINSLLNAIPFPEIPSKYITGKFQDPIMAITNNTQVVAATSFEDSPTPSLEGYIAPEKDVYLQAGLKLVNNALAKKLNQFKFEKEVSTGNALAKATARIKGTVNNVYGMIMGGKTLVDVSIVNITAYAELSSLAASAAKTALCPIGTTLDVNSDSGDWDKVISNFSITYSPDPLQVPLMLRVTTKESDDYVELSIGSIDSVNIDATPEWSGTIGTTLAAIAAQFLDFLPESFKTEIVNTIIKAEAQNIEVWKNPSINKQIEGIGIILSAEQGAALRPQGDTLIVEGFTISFS
jgi:hypothetical protein